MPPIVSFIGWHNSGKTTLASKVVGHLKARGYSVAVIKSSKEEGIVFDQPGTDTSLYRHAGADSVTLVAPDQMVLTAKNPGTSLTTLVHRYFSDMDIVIAEGFKQARQVAKIEVCRDDSDHLLRDQVTGVIAIATDRNIAGDHIFRLDESRELTDFIEKRFLAEVERSTEQVVLLVNGTRVVLKDFVQQALAGTVTGFVRTLKVTTEQINEIELKIRIERP